MTSGDGSRGRGLGLGTRERQRQQRQAEEAAAAAASSRIAARLGSEDPEPHQSLPDDHRRRAAARIPTNTSEGNRQKGDLS